MHGMKRPLSIAAAFFAALTLLALPASAESARVVRGTITSIAQDAVAVQAASGIVTTCSVVKRSPHPTGFESGDRVQMVCAHLRGHAKLVLAKLRHLPALPVAAASDDASTKFGGAITALSDDSISLHDGDRDLTCKLDASSPSTADYEVGQHVKVVCAGGTLVAIASVTSDVGRYFTGTVAEIGASSLTITTDHGPVTCTFGDGSPSIAALHVGDHVGMGCKASTMQLVLIKKLDGDAGTTTTTGTETTTTTTTSTTTHVLTGAAGTLSALTDGSITVHTDGGQVTCSIGASSPSVASFAVGDRVKMACWDGVLHEIARVS
jgi:hypothetical protein